MCISIIERFHGVFIMPFWVWRGRYAKAGNIPESAALRQRLARGLPADVFSQVELDGVAAYRR